MYNIDITDSPDAPVATPGIRRTMAIHWHWTTEYTNEQIADALGVTPQTIRAYLKAGPNEEVKEQVANLEAEVRTTAVMELKQQLKAAGHRSRTADKPVEIWQNDDGDLFVQEKRDEDSGELIDRYPIPDGYDLLPDEQARFYAREEVRNILEQLTDLVGAAEPNEHEVTLTEVLRGDG